MRPSDLCSLDSAAKMYQDKCQEGGEVSTVCRVPEQSRMQPALYPSAVVWFDLTRDDAHE